MFISGALVLGVLWSCEHSHRGGLDNASTLDPLDRSNQSTSQRGFAALLHHMYNVKYTFYRRFRSFTYRPQHNRGHYHSANGAAKTITFTGSNVYGWQYNLTTQCRLNLSVFTVCIPYVKNLLLGIEFGFFQTRDFRLQISSRIDNLIC